MRTLRKSLALVLCVVMVLGLCVFSVSAKSIDDYPDNKQIQYREAVQLLSELGIMNGRSTGDQGFDPLANLTRAEGATMIVRMLGVSNPVGISSFNDVEEFYQPYIATLENRDIINGYAPGVFGPNDPLTGSAFAKMMLCAAGYKPEREGLTGPMWEVAVAKLIKSNDLDDGMNNFDQTKPITREEAAQIALNGLQMREVEYTGNNINITGSDINFSMTDGKGYEDVTTTKSSGGNIKAERDSDNRYYLEFGEDYFPDLKKNKGVDEEDDLGRPANVWQLKNTTICTAPKDPVAVFTNKADEKDIAAALSGYKLFTENVGVRPDDVSITNNSSDRQDNTIQYYLADIDDDDNTSYPVNKGFVWLNGGSDKSTGVLAQQRLSSDTDRRTPAAFIKEYLLKNGAQVEFYADDNNYISDIVVLDFDAAKVTNITTASNGDVTYTFGASTGYSGNISNSIGTKHLYANSDDSDIEVYGTIAKNDYVTYVKGTDKVHVFPTTVVTGAQTSNNGDNKIVVDGTTYTTQFRQKNAVPAKYENSKDTYNYYLDQFGYIVHSDSVAVSVSDYAVVDRIAGVFGSGTSGDAYVEAVLVFTDGTKHTVRVTEIDMNDGEKYRDVESIDDYATTDKDESVYVTDAGDGSEYLLGGLDSYRISTSYTENNNLGYGQRIVTYERDGSDYKLKYTDDHMLYEVTNDQKVLSKGAAMIGRSSGNIYGTVYGNSGTVYIVRTDSVSSPTFKIYTGYANIPTITSPKNAAAGATPVRYVTRSSDDSVVLVYVDAIDDNATPDTDDAVLYVTSDNVGTIGTNNDNGYAYVEGILDGVKRSGDNPIRVKYTMADELSDLVKTYKDGKLGGFVMVEVDDKGYIDMDKATRRMVYTDGNMPNEEKWHSGTVSEVTLDNLSTGLNGYVTKSSTKVYVIDDDDVRVGSLDDAQLNDRYVIKTAGGKGDSDEYILNVVYLVHDNNEVFFGDATTTQASLSLDDNDEVTITGNLLVKGNLNIPRGTTLYVNGDVEGSDYNEDYVINATEGSIVVLGDVDFNVTINGDVSYPNRSISRVELASTDTIVYDGNAKTPEVIAYDQANRRIPTNYYRVSYSNNTNYGINTASVTVTGQNGYSGSRTINFTINQATLTGITVDAINMTVGDPAKLVNVNNLPTMPYSLSFETGNHAIATVSEDGNVTAVAAGETYVEVTVTPTNTNYAPATVRANVTVAAAVPQAETPVEVETEEEAPAAETEEEAPAVETEEEAPAAETEEEAPVAETEAEAPVEAETEAPAEETAEA